MPHAGYRYSGAVAASAYLRIEAARHSIRRVVVLGPSHRVPLRGLGLSSAGGWATPLGIVPISADAGRKLRDLPWIAVNDRAHAAEHSLEVQLPFLQTVLDDVELVPLVVGDASPTEVSAVIDAVWTASDTLVVVSTDLSHYRSYREAVTLDARTAAAIVAGRAGDVADHDACGARAVRGLLRAAGRRGLEVELLDLRNSGDTTGDEEQVVGYGAFALIGTRAGPRDLGPARSPSQS